MTKEIGRIGEIRVAVTPDGVEAALKDGPSTNLSPCDARTLAALLIRGAEEHDAARGRMGTK